MACYGLIGNWLKKTQALYNRGTLLQKIHTCVSNKLKPDGHIKLLTMTIADCMFVHVINNKHSTPSDY